MKIAWTEILDLEPARAPWPSDRSFRATWQIRCSGCGRFAKVVRSGQSGYYVDDDPWWEVDCKRCGLTEGMSGEQ